MLVGNTVDVHAQTPSLEVSGDTGRNRAYTVNEPVNTTFTPKIDGIPVPGEKLKITFAGLHANVTVDLGDGNLEKIDSGDTVTSVGLSVEVAGTISDSKGAWIQAEWSVRQQSARADFNFGDKAPLLIVVNSPIDIGDTFTQSITVENRDSERDSCPSLHGRWILSTTPQYLEWLVLKKAIF